MTLTRSQPSQARNAASEVRMPSPPSEAEARSYFDRGTQRWLIWLTVVCFGGVAYSLAGFSYRLHGNHLGADPWINLALYLPLTFFAPLFLYSFTILISAYTSSARPEITLASHEQLIADFRRSQPLLGSVDVFLPSAGEPLELLRNTFRHVAELQWGNDLEVYVLDDSGRLEVRGLADEFGFRYESRPNRGFMKKAGNLKYGFSISQGDFIAILDADFVPRPDYLWHLIPYFQDSTVGIVQSPQYFDTSRVMTWLERAAGATQELFYRSIQCGRGRLGAAICVGTCAVYRREALSAIGGFPQIGHSEDVFTGVRMSALKYHVCYVPIIIAKGVCPNRLSSFINQQYRWCTGSLTLMRDPSFRYNDQLSRRQSLCFWSGFLYYVGTAVQTLTYFLPAIIMVWFFPRYVFLSNSLPLLGVFALWLIVLPITSVSRWRPEVLRVQTIYGFAHLMSIRDVLAGREAGWVPTNGASKSSMAARTTTYMCVTILVSQVVLYVGIFFGAERFGWNNFWGMLALTVFRSYIELPIVYMAFSESLHEKGRLSRDRLRARHEAVT